MFRRFSSETYTLEDCHYYNDNTYSASSVTLNVPLPNNSFSLEYLIKQGASSSGMPYLDIGDSSSDRMLVGQYARAGGNGLIVYKPSATTYAYSSNPQSNQENSIYFSYDGANYNYSLNDGTALVVPDKNVTLSKLIHIEGGGASNNYLKNIKIKPL